MSSLKLIITEEFGDLECNFYRNMNDDILLTRDQIGTALEYSNPSKVEQIRLFKWQTLFDREPITNI